MILEVIKREKLSILFLIIFTIFLILQLIEGDAFSGIINTLITLFYFCMIILEVLDIALTYKIVKSESEKLSV